MTTGAATPSMTKNNILLLIADDLGLYTGAYGCNSVKTPCLDLLAASGTKFTNAFTSTASCSASRSCIYTGLHSHENGQYGLNTQDGAASPRQHFTTFDHVETAPLLFNHLGYQTGIIGKVHVGSSQVYPWMVREENGTRNVRWVADRCDAFFRKAKDAQSPFFLTVGFVDPHRDTSTRAGFGNEELCDGQVEIPDFKSQDVEVPSWLTDLPETRTEMVEYYKAISRMDAGIGLILEALKRQDLKDDTLVIFLSDNGPPFINSKTTMYDAGIRLPLIVRQPGGSAGVTNPNMVSFIDILPTLLDWASRNDGYSPEIPKVKGVSPPRLGRSFLPILSHREVLPEQDWPHHVYGSHTFHEIQNYWPTRFIRTRRYKYHRNLAWRLDFPFASDLYASLSFEGVRNMPRPAKIGERNLKDYVFRPAEELYDLSTDPDEVRNLAGDEQYNDIVKDLRQRLEAWQIKTEDIWVYRDGVSVTVLQRYVEKGLQIPDRLDFDAARPEINGTEVWQGTR